MECSGAGILRQLERQLRFDGTQALATMRPFALQIGIQDSYDGEFLKKKALA